MLPAFNCLKEKARANWILYCKSARQGQVGVKNHISPEVADVQKAVAILEARPAFKAAVHGPGWKERQASGQPLQSG